MDGREPPRMSLSQAPNLLVGPGSYVAGATYNPMATPSSVGIIQGPRLSFNSTTSLASNPVPVTGSVYQGDGVSGASQGSLFNMDEPITKKRGRPRKYGPDGSVSLALTPSSTSEYSNSPAKRRGRPPGSGKKQQLEALGAPGSGFTPHISTVNVGEDIASEIMTFSEQGTRSICILSANGAISNVTLKQPAVSGGTVTLEGRFEIISLSGPSFLTEDGNTRNGSGELSIALAGSDGRILGGVVAGRLVAATPVQVVVGSFISAEKKSKPDPMKSDLSPAPPHMTGLGAGPAHSEHPSEGTSSESSDDPDGNPTNQRGATYSNYIHHVQSPYPSVIWSHTVNANRHESDFKMAPN